MNSKRKKINYGGLYIDSLKQLKKAIINTKSKENNCFQYTARVA